MDRKGVPKQQYVDTLDGLSRYLDKLRIIDNIDPYTLPSGSWGQDEASFPAVSYPDIVNYLIFGKSFYSMDDMKAWKSLEAYNQLTSGWISDLSICVKSGYHVVSAKVSQRLKVGLYFRRRQALWHAFIRLSNAYKSVLRRICLYFSRRHQRRQRARESVARRKMLQSSTVLNFHALRQRTQAIQPIIYRCHELSLQRIDLAITS